MRFLTLCEHYNKIERYNINHGIPQGTIFVPPLFILYIHFLFEVDCVGKILAYADDTLIVYNIDTWEDLFKIAEEDLSKN